MNVIALQLDSRGWRCMNRFLAGACAVSVLAAAYAAHAISDPNSASLAIAIKGTVHPYCTIVTSTGYKPSWDSDRFDKMTTSTGLLISFPNFAKADGTGNDISGNATLNIDANAPCNYVLKSANGVLKNSQAQAVRPYYADAHAESGSSQPVYLDSPSTNKTVNSFIIDAPPSTRSLVIIDVHIPPSGLLPPGEYQDTLTLTIAPQ
jgi:hypothetical protein